MDKILSGTNLILMALIIGMLFYFNECKETDYLTKSQGEKLATISEESIEMLYNLFQALNKIDSSRVINEYYTTIYKDAKNEKDSIVRDNPALADSLFLHWIKLLQSNSTGQPFNGND